MAGELQGALAYLEEGNVANPTYVRQPPSADGSEPNGFVLNGSKTVVLNGPEADLYYLGAYVLPNRAPLRVSVCFLSAKNAGPDCKIIKPTMAALPAELQLDQSWWMRSSGG